MDIGVRRRFTIADYHRMGDVGILGCDERLELIDGELIVREPIGSHHAGTVTRVSRLWTLRLGQRALVSIQNPLVLPNVDSELQPDVTILAPRADFYTTSHPLPADVLLLIEVADTSLRLDRRVKLPLYARAGIREAWLCDLTTGRIEVHREPTAQGYGAVRVHGRGASLAAVAFPDLALTVDDLLG
ncbi:MAG TPA: Uma2 family endonuclease [Methylomirabilota bacterium]|jgi:Uma2 family endonuclease|nr:Uma2 family endonuclease [Methylomirabilota bacterium]